LRIKETGVADKIRYYLIRNPFNSSGESRYTARMQKNGLLYQEELIGEMLKKRTSLTRQNIIAVLDLLKETVAEQVLRGNAVHTDLFRADVSIRGDFDSFDERFDDSKHRVCLNMKASLDLKREILRRAEVKAGNALSPENPSSARKNCSVQPSRFPDSGALCRSLEAIREKQDDLDAFPDDSGGRLTDQGRFKAS
jgi:hypothetical protein